jgi:hypothetical protein
LKLHRCAHRYCFTHDDGAPCPVTAENRTHQEVANAEVELTLIDDPTDKRPSLKCDSVFFGERRGHLTESFERGSAGELEDYGPLRTRHDER